MMETLQIGDLTFGVIRSPRRKTVELGVERDGSLIVRAPVGVADERLVKFATRKRSWVYEKLALKGALTPVPARREFVSGEGFRYLGRSYRLILVEQQNVPLKLVEGRFRLKRGDAAGGREHFVAWYLQHGQPWLTRRVGAWAVRMGTGDVTIGVRDLGFRWGSCAPGGQLCFNWATITLPPGIIDYVVVHELAHVLHPNHGPEFWAALGRAMPDWEVRKRWLAERGSDHGI